MMRPGGLIVIAASIVKLKDLSEVLIRPMVEDDLQRSHAFFRALPPEDRACLRRDVTKLEVVRERMHEMEVGTVRRLVALAGDEIIADGALELSRSGWERHVGELRIIVARPYQRKGLGLLMASALYDLASSEDLEELIVKMIDTQAAARSIFSKLGFREEAVLSNFVNVGGGRRNLVLMRCELENLWRGTLTEN
jgi:L-amino acid N-acyltransferase YncA